MNQVQQEAHPAAVAQEFMRRADMKGGEVEAFGHTFNWLAGFLEGEIIATPKEAHEALLEELKELRDFKEKAEKSKALQREKFADDLPVLEPEVPAAELEAVDSETDETA